MKSHYTRLNNCNTQNKISSVSILRFEFVSDNYFTIITFFFCKKGKQGLERSNNVVTLGIKREITLYMSLITSVKGSSLYWMSLLMRILPLPRWR